MDTVGKYVNVLEKSVTNTDGHTGKNTVRKTKYVCANGLVEEINDDHNWFYHYDKIGNTTMLTNQNGRVVEHYKYSAYGEVLSGERSKTEYLYNGQFGIINDGNGLYYMRARYYNVGIRRFMNQDTLRGSVQNSRILNRYSYAQGNPINFNAPFGMSPNDDYKWGSYWDWMKVGCGGILDRLRNGDMGLVFGWLYCMHKARSYLYDELKENIHTVLDVVGCLPVVGCFADGANAVLYATEGITKMRR